MGGAQCTPSGGRCRGPMSSALPPHEVAPVQAGRLRVGRARVGRARVGRARVGRARVGRPWVGRPWVGRPWVGRPWVGRVEAKPKPDEKNGRRDLDMSGFATLYPTYEHEMGPGNAARTPAPALSGFATLYPTSSLSPYSSGGPVWQGRWRVTAWAGHARPTRARSAPGRFRTPAGLRLLSAPTRL